MKKQLSLFLFLFTISIPAWAQTSKGAVGLVGSADFYRFDFKPDAQAGGQYDGVFNYSLGLQGSYRFTDSFSGRLGVLGAKKGFEKTFVNPVPDPAFQEQIRDIRLDIYYLDVPVLFDYDFYLNQTVSVFASAGVVPGFLIDEKEVSNYTTDTDRRTEYMNQNLNDFVLAGQLSGGFKLQFTDTKSLRIEPYFRKYFDKMAPNLMQQNPHVYGVQLGIYQHF